MTLREELLKITPDEAMSALDDQMATETYPKKDTFEQVMERYQKLLEEYPSLYVIFSTIAEYLRDKSSYKENVKRDILVANGLGLLAVKAMANKQLFDGLEIPSDLDESN